MDADCSSKKKRKDSEEHGKGLHDKTSNDERVRKTKAAKKHAKRREEIKKPRASESLAAFVKAESLKEEHGAWSEEHLSFAAKNNVYTTLRKLPRADVSHRPTDYPDAQVIRRAYPEVQKGLNYFAPTPRRALRDPSYRTPPGNMINPNFTNPFLSSNTGDRSAERRTPIAQDLQHVVSYSGVPSPGTPSPSLLGVPSYISNDFMVSPKTIPPTSLLANPMERDRHHRQETSLNPQYLDRQITIQQQTVEGELASQYNEADFAAVPFDLTDEVATEHNHWHWIYDTGPVTTEPPWLLSTPETYPQQVNHMVAHTPQSFAPMGPVIGQAYHPPPQSMYSPFAPMVSLQQQTYHQAQMQMPVNLQMVGANTEYALPMLDMDMTMNSGLPEMLFAGNEQNIQISAFNDINL